ncbi:MAG: AI-2E family transporter, partial [Actinomycetes bacterium]
MLQVRLTVGSTLLVIGAVATALVISNLFGAARRPVAWAVAASVVAWLLSWVISVLDRWIPRPLAVLATMLGFVVLVVGGWVGVRATLRLEVDKLRTALPAAAQDLEQRYDAVASFHLAERTQAFMNSLDERFGTQAQVAAAAGTASTYMVTGVLMLFLLAYGPRFVSAALRQIADPDRRESVAAVLYRASNGARAYLLIALAQTIAITAICSVVFYLLDLPAPFVLGLLVGWLSAIPYLGIIVSGLAPLLAAATEPHVFTYAVLVALLVGLQLVEAFVIRPRVDRRTIRVGPALMLIGTLIGFEAYGVGGAIYGTALLVLLWAVWQAMLDREAWPAPSEPAAIAGAAQPDAAATRPSELQAQPNPVSGAG